jgi:hypothetical protein
MNARPPQLTPPPVVEIERHLKWRLLPTLLFIALLTLLAVATVASLVLRPQHPAGLPDDPDARRAATALAGRVALPVGPLRVRAAVLGGEPASGAPGTWALSLGESARPALEAARRRHPRDPRALAALGALDLMAARWAQAADRYRQACELAPHYGEGRLGAGVALACDADNTHDAWRARGLRLQAIAQFAQVDSLDAEYPLALFDRAFTLRFVDRPREAAFYARRYLARDDTSAWARALRQ